MCEDACVFMTAGATPIWGPLLGLLVWATVLTRDESGARSSGQGSWTPDGSPGESRIGTSLMKLDHEFSRLPVIHGLGFTRASTAVRAV